MRPGTLLRLALAGTRTDTARVVLTALAAMCAALSILSAATVFAISGWADQYTNALLIEPGLRPGTALALLLLCIPVLALAGQCSRLGAPARDRRLAAIRLAGATPRQVTAVAVTETAVASALGALLGIAVYAGGRALLHRPGPDGRLPLPTDQLPPAAAIAAVVVGLPLLASVAAAVLLRRAAFTPFGVVRRQRTRPPNPWPAALVIPGVGAFVVIEPLARWFQRAEAPMPLWVLSLLLGGGGLLATIGVILGTAWLSHTAGRILYARSRGPATLLAARRLMADPWTGSRVFAALLACVLVGAGAAGVRAWFTAGFEVEQASNRAWAEAAGETYLDDSDRYAFYYRAFDLINAAVAVAVVIAALGLLVFAVEGIVSRRRAYTAMVATGVPRRTLARALSWQMLAPVVPAIALALVVGLAMPRAMSREARSGRQSGTVCEADDPALCEALDSPYLRTVETPEFVQPVAIPVGQLAVIGGVALAAVTVSLGVSLLFLRSSTDISDLRTT